MGQEKQTAGGIYCPGDISATTVGTTRDSARLLIMADLASGCSYSSVESIVDELVSENNKSITLVMTVENAENLVRKLIDELYIYSEEFADLLGAHARAKRHRMRIIQKLEGKTNNV